MSMDFQFIVLICCLQSSTYANYFNDIKVNVIPARITLKPGEQIRLKCNHSNEVDLISWMLNYDHLDHIGMYMIIEIKANNYTSQAGIYQCVTWKAGYGIHSYPARVDVAYIQQPSTTVSILQRSVRAGTSVNVSCLVPLSFPTPKIAFYINKKLIMLGKSYLQNENRLFIFDISDRHEGTYSCSATNPYTGETVFSHQLVNISLAHNSVTTVAKPFLIGSSKSDIIYADIHSNVRIVCVFGGYPTPSVNWNNINPQHPPSRVVFDRLGLVIHNVTTRDTSHYVCVGRNAHGVVRRTVDIQITDPPQVFIAQSHVTRHVNDTHVQIDCEYSGGRPTPQVYWLRYGKLASSQTTTGHRRRMHFATISHKHMGVYSCLGVNSAGFSIKHMLLDVPVVNKIRLESAENIFPKPTQPLVFQITNSSVLIQWELSILAENLKSVSLFRIQYLRVSDAENLWKIYESDISNIKRRFIMEGLTINTVYRFKVIVVYELEKDSRYKDIASDSSQEIQLHHLREHMRPKHPPDIQSIVSSECNALNVTWAYRSRKKNGFLQAETVKHTGPSAVFPHAHRRVMVDVYFLLYRVRQEIDYMQVAVFGNNQTHYRLTGLANHTDYEITIMAYNRSGGLSTHSKSVYTRTCDPESHTRTPYADDSVHTLLDDIVQDGAGVGGVAPGRYGGDPEVIRLRHQLYTVVGLVLLSIALSVGLCFVCFYVRTQSQSCAKLRAQLLSYLCWPAAHQNRPYMSEDQRSHHELLDISTRANGHSAGTANTNCSIKKHPLTRQSSLLAVSLPDVPPVSHESPVIKREDRNMLDTGSTTRYKNCSSNFKHKLLRRDSLSRFFHRK